MDSIFYDIVRFPSFFVITRTKMGIGEKNEGQKKMFSPQVLIQLKVTNYSFLFLFIILAAVCDFELDLFIWNF